MNTVVWMPFMILQWRIGFESQGRLTSVGLGRKEKPYQKAFRHEKPCGHILITTEWVMQQVAHP